MRFIEGGRAATQVPTRRIETAKRTLVGPVRKRTLRLRIPERCPRSGKVRLECIRGLKQKLALPPEPKRNPNYNTKHELTTRRWLRCRGFTLLEISLVLGLILGLSVMISFGYNSVTGWRKGRDAGLSLQAVYAAQRAYMADNPTAEISVVTAAQLNAYLPQGWLSLPVFVGLNGEVLTLRYVIMPPVLLSGSSLYDPSAKSTDGLWDVGE